MSAIPCLSHTAMLREESLISVRLLEAAQNQPLNRCGNLCLAIGQIFRVALIPFKIAILTILSIGSIGGVFYSLVTRNCKDLTFRFLQLTVAFPLQAITAIFIRVLKILLAVSGIFIPRIAVTGWLLAEKLDIAVNSLEIYFRKKCGQDFIPKQPVTGQNSPIKKAANPGSAIEYLGKAKACLLWQGLTSDRRSAVSSEFIQYVQALDSLDPSFLPKVLRLDAMNPFEQDAKYNECIPHLMQFLLPLKDKKEKLNFVQLMESHLSKTDRMQNLLADKGDPLLDNLEAFTRYLSLWFKIESAGRASGSDIPQDSSQAQALKAINEQEKALEERVDGLRGFGKISYFKQ